MKRFYFTLAIALLCSVTAFANTVVIQGQIRYSDGTPVQGQWVSIWDSTSTGGCQVYHTKFTDQNGYYKDTISCTGNIDFIRIASFDKCNNTYLFAELPVTPSGLVQKDFVLSCAAPSCQADFSFTTQGLTASFTSSSTSTDSIVQYAWTFNGPVSGSSSAPNPSFTYSAPGTYQVTLVITTAMGCTSQITKTVTVSGGGTSCHADFWINQSPQYVAVVSLSGSGQGDSIVTYNWNFGDGTIISGTAPAITHTYASAGTYSITLTIITQSSCVDSFTRVVTVNSMPPISCQAQYADSIAGNDVYFSSSASFTNPNDQIVYRSWDFGDGSAPVSGLNVVHTFQAPGSYTVCLKIVTANGCVDSTCRVITINPIPPAGCNADFSFAVSNASVSFTNLSNSGGSGASYLWDLGDGTTSTAANPFHYYNFNGTYTVKLTIFAAGGCVDSIAKQVVINTNMYTCHGQFSAVKDNTNPLQYHLQGSPVAGSGDSITGITWYLTRYNSNWYDSIMGNITSPVYQFPDTGLYTICMTFYTAANCYKQICKDIYVSQGNTQPPCHANFAYTVGAGGVVNFTNTSVYNAPSAGQLWEFGNGIFSTAFNTTYTYQPGTYNACLTINNTLGCTDSICKTITIAPPPPTNCTSKFTFQHTTSGGVAFNSATSTGSTTADSIVTRLWTFGDGSQLGGNVVAPFHQFPSAGNYQVCLQITTAAGCQKTTCKSVNIVDSSCQANFTYAVGANGIVTFTNTSNTTGNAQYLWTFSNGGSSTAISPVRSFPPGSYTACLVLNFNGCVDSVCKTFTVPPPPPPTNCGAAFTYSGLPVTPGVGQYVIKAFSNNSHATTTVGDSIISRTWIWGDGAVTNGNVVAPTHAYNAAGTYSVCLVIQTVNGCSDTSCKTVTLPMANQVFCQPKFVYSYLPDSGTARKISFNSTMSVALPGDSIISRKWEFGTSGVLTGNVVSPVYTFSQPGVYNVCLTIKTALGCEKKECRMIVIPQVAGACVPHFVWQRTGPKQITFNSSMSWTPVNDSIVERKWNFGDATPGLSGNVISPVHNYANNGVYTVSLKIKTANNCEKTFFGTVMAQDSVVNPSTQDRIRIISLYPSPATYQTQAVVWSLQNNIQAELAVYDVYGTKKWSLNKVLVHGNNVTVIPTGFLAPGPYYFRVTTMFGVRSRAFFKQ